VTPRTFSLARLLLAVTLFCVLCGLAVNYPVEALAFIALPSLFVLPPTFCVLLSKLGRRPNVSFTAAMIGMFSGYAVDFLLSRVLLPAWQPISSLEPLDLADPTNPFIGLGLTLVVLACGANPPLLGALLAGGAVILKDRYSPALPPPNSLDAQNEPNHLPRH
jgi:hypothetical protein